MLSLMPASYVAGQRKGTVGFVYVTELQEQIHTAAAAEATGDTRPSAALPRPFLALSLVGWLVGFAPLFSSRGSNVCV